MNDERSIVVVGLGEVGRPLFELLSKFYRAVGVDVAPLTKEVGETEFLHVCYPFQIGDFVGETARYIQRFHPKVTVINSTVSVGTTRMIADRTGATIVNSPVRGKHTRMLEELSHYTKFIGTTDPAAGEQTARHFQCAGLKTKVLTSPEASELAKLTETTYFGLMIAWAQEIERYCDKTGANYEEIISFYDEIKFFPPVKYFPGVIGGHCVLPNIQILSNFTSSELLNAIRNSNEMKIEREALLKSKAVPVESTEPVNG
jgi:UDP-N-acetyl-D-mannosaminuronate dehydrogenase